MSGFERDERVASLFAEGLGAREIAEAIGVSRRTVSKDLIRLGLVVPVDKEARNARIVELYESGLTQAQVAEEVGLKQVMVGRILKKKGVESRPSSPPTFDVDEAMKLYASGLKQREVAEVMGVSQTTIQRQLTSRGVEMRDSRVYDIDKTFFDEPNLVNSYWAGFLAADGCLVARSGRFHVTLLLAEKDRQSLVDFKEASGLGHPIRPVTKPNGHRYCVVSVSCEEWHQALASNFNVVPNKTKSLQPPPLEEEALQWAFARGYFDGDGHVPKERACVQITCSSMDFMEWIIRDLFGSNHAISPIKSKNGSSLACSVHGDTARDVAYDLYANSTPKTRMSRKYERFEAAGLV